MSTTHPTDVTTEWDDIQRKYGNLPPREKEQTAEELDAAFVELTEAELLREARLKEWKRRMARSRAKVYGAPVTITASNFVEEVTDASKDDEAAEAPDLAAPAAKSGRYVPVLLLDDSREAGLLRDAWHALARRFPALKFALGSAANVLRASGCANRPPSSVLLYFGGACVLQRNVSALFRTASFEISADSLENRLAAALENVLNSAAGHRPLARAGDADPDDSSDSESDSESDSGYLRAAGRDLRNDFLNKLTRRPGGDNAKTYTSRVLDEALRD